MRRHASTQVAVSRLGGAEARGRLFRTLSHYLSCLGTQREVRDLLWTRERAPARRVSQTLVSGQARAGSERGADYRSPRPVATPGGSPDRAGQRHVVPDLHSPRPKPPCSRQIPRPLPSGRAKPASVGAVASSGTSLASQGPGVSARCLATDAAGIGVVVALSPLRRSEAQRRCETELTSGLIEGHRRNRVADLGWKVEQLVETTEDLPGRVLASEELEELVDRAVENAARTTWQEKLDALARVIAAAVDGDDTIVSTSLPWRLRCLAGSVRTRWH